MRAQHSISACLKGALHEAKPPYLLAFHCGIYFFSIAIGVSGCLLYESQKEQFKKTRADELTAIADLKVDGITKWRIERVGDANVIFQPPIIASKVQEWFEEPQGQGRREAIHKWMSALSENYHYQSIILVDVRGNIRLSTADDILGATAKKLIKEAMRGKKVILSDIYLSTLPGNPVRISLVAPLFIYRNGNSFPIGAFLLRIDPHQFLYPLIQSWPTPSRTSETVQVRREGEHILYLNELRHRKNTALSFSLPMDKRDLPDVMAVQGQRGIVEAVDYRGVPVVAVLREVPGFPWFLVVKVDMEELFAPLRERALFVAVFVALMVVSSGLILGLFWRRQEGERLRTARDELENMVRERTLEIEQARSRNELILDTSGEGIYMLDAHGRIMFVNLAASRMLGYDAGDLIGRQSHEAFHHSKADGTRYAVEECLMNITLLDGRTHSGSDEVFWRKDGSGFPVDYTSTPMNEAGLITGVVVVFKDITERKLAEDNILKSQESLAEAQRIAHMGNWDWNILTNELKWSDEIYRIFGFAPQQFDVTYDAFLKSVHPDDRLAVQKGVDDGLYNNIPYSIDHRIILNDGSERVVHEQARVYFDEAGRPVRMIGTVQDITERKRAEDAQKRLNADLMQYAARLETANTELAAFTYSASHVLRAPLRAINSFTRILMDEYGDKVNDEGKRLLKVVSENAAKMGQYIADILEHSSLGKKDLVLAVTDMETLVREAISENKDLIKGRRVEFKVEPLAPALGDEQMLRLVIRILLSNALKFTKTKETANIEIGGKADEDMKVYYVKDNGVGFDMQHSGKLFGVFNRLHGDDEFEGTGIGLAIVKRIIEKHGGKVWADGKVGEGAIFYFTLPGPPTG